MTVREEEVEPEVDNSMIEEIENLAEERVSEDNDETKESVDDNEDLTSAEPEDSDQDRDLDSGEVDLDEEPEDDGDSVPVIEDALLERAIKAGMSLADAKAVSNSAALENIISRMEGNESQDDGGVAGAEDKADDEDLLSKIPDLDPDEYPEEVVETFKMMKSVLKEQQEKISSLTGSQQSDEGQQFIAWFDSEINGLGDDFTEVFGNVDSGSISETQVEARKKVARHMDLVVQDLRADGKQIPSDRDILRMAVDSAFPERVIEKKGKAIANAARNRARKAMRQPRDDNGKFVSDDFDIDDPVAAATAAVRKLMEQSD